jgi:hypothetical protein
MPRSGFFALFAALVILVVAQRAPAESAPFPVEPSMVGVEDAFPVEVGRNADRRLSVIASFLWTF